MADLTRYELADGIATITLDDGKANALSVMMLGELAGRLDQAEADGAVVVLHRAAAALFRRFRSQHRARGMAGDAPRRRADGGAAAVVSSPDRDRLQRPRNRDGRDAVAVLRCARRGRGEFQIGLNEVAIGLTLPWFAIALARHRLAAPARDRYPITGVLVGPAAAREAGFLDEVVEAAALMGAARAHATQLLSSQQATRISPPSSVRGRWCSPS